MDKTSYKEKRGGLTVSAAIENTIYTDDVVLIKAGLPAGGQQELLGSKKSTQSSLRPNRGLFVGLKRQGVL
jgi:hypothetical protein